MALPQPRGIKFWGGVLILYGGFSSLLTALELFESIRFYGFDSILVMSPAGLAGFVIYGFTPVSLYVTGVGLFMSRPWARRMTLIVLPLLLAFFFLNQAMHVARLLAEGPLSSLELFSRHFNIFANFFLVYLVLIVPMLLYFRNPVVTTFFSLQDPR